MIIKGGTVATPVPYKEYVDARVLTASDPNNDGNIVLKYGASVEGGGSSTGGGDIVVTDEQIANAVSNYMAENPIDVGVKTVNGNQPDENGNVNVDIPGGGSGGGISAEEVQSMIDEAVSAYAGVNVLYEYKQNADYQEIAEVDEDGYYCCYVKISTEVPEASSFIGKTVRYIKDHKGYTHDNSYVVTEDEIIQDMNGVYCIGDLWDVIVVLNNESEFASDGLTVGVWHISKIKYDNVDETTIWLQVVEPHVTSKDVQTMIDNSLGVIENGTY